MTEAASLTKTTDRDRARRAPPHARGLVRRPGRARAALWGVLIAAALVVRVIGLGERAFHHDESQDAYFSFLFRQTGDYEYNPLLHGPLRFYLTALMYVLFGDSDFTARLAPALMGLSMVPLCWPLRPLLGRGARVRRGRAVRLRAELPVLQPLRPRGHLRRRDHARAAGRHLALPGQAAEVLSGADRPLLAPPSRPRRRRSSRSS